MCKLRLKDEVLSMKAIGDMVVVSNGKYAEENVGIVYDRSILKKEEFDFEKEEDLDLLLDQVLISNIPLYVFSLEVMKEELENFLHEDLISISKYNDILSLSKDFHGEDYRLWEDHLIYEEDEVDFLFNSHYSRIERDLCVVNPDIIEILKFIKTN